MPPSECIRCSCTPTAQSSSRWSPNFINSFFVSETSPFWSVTLRSDITTPRERLLCDLIISRAARTILRNGISLSFYDEADATGKAAPEAVPRADWMTSDCFRTARDSVVKRWGREVFAGFCSLEWTPVPTYNLCNWGMNADLTVWRVNCCESLWVYKKKRINSITSI